MSNMTFGWLLTVVAGGLTMVSLGIIILCTKILKSFQKSETAQKTNWPFEYWKHIRLLILLKAS